MSLHVSDNLMDHVTDDSGITPSDLTTLAELSVNKARSIDIAIVRALAAVYNAFRLHDAIVDFAGQSAGQIAYDRTCSRGYAVAAAQATAKATSERFTV